MWFETHAHLSDSKFDTDRDLAVKRALDSGVSTIVEIADGPDEWPKAQMLAEKYPGSVFWAAGLHPYYADKSSPHVWDRLAAIARHPQFVAVGEIGLDYAKCPIPHDQQAEAFRKGIGVALAANKPLIIHCREAYADLMPILREFFSPGRSKQPGVVHCFSGETEHARELTELGFYLGVDGPVTYPSAKALRLALDSVPSERIVLETDSPYLPPQSHRGQRNEPSLLPQIGAHLAALRQLSPDKLAEITRENSRKLFRLNPA